MKTRIIVEGNSMNSNQGSTTASQAMREHVALYLTQTDITLERLAAITGIETQQLSEKQQGQQPYTLDEAIAMYRALELDSVDELAAQTL